MARYLFVTWDGSGNQNPELGLAQALRLHGHEAIFAGYASQQARIERAGFRFRLMERASAAFTFPPQGDALAWLTAGVWATPAHLEDVREVVAREAPDLLVIDCLLFGALTAAERDHLPAAVFVHGAPGAHLPPGGPFEQMVLLRPVNALRTSAGLAPVASLWENWARFPTLCATLPALDPLAASAPAAFTYVGPIQEDVPFIGWQAPWPAGDARPLTLVSFSSGLAWDQTSRIQRTLDALAEQPVRVVVTASQHTLPAASIPDNARIFPFIPHAELLPRAAVVVTHGGHGTLTAALAHGVPVVCLPNATSDQPILAAQAAALGAGVALDGEMATPQVIGDAVQRVIAEPSSATAARRLADEIAAMDAPARAVAWLEAHTPPMP